LARHEPGAYATDLVSALNNRAAALGQLGRYRDAVDPAHEAIATLRPAFFGLPNVHMRAMVTSVSAYLTAVKLTGQQPDETLLEPILVVLRQVDDRGAVGSGPTNDFDAETGEGAVRAL
jgi:hypothetical protein